MESRPRSQSIVLQRQHFDERGKLRGNGIIRHPGNLRFDGFMGDVQIQSIDVAGSVTAGTGTNLYIKQSIISGGEISIRGYLESEECVEAIHGIYIDGGVNAWDGIKAASIDVSVRLKTFGNVLCKHSITVKGEIKISKDLMVGSNATISKYALVDGDIKIMGILQSDGNIKCLKSLKAAALYAKGDVFVGKCMKILQQVKIKGSLKVFGNIIVPVKLEVNGDIEYIGYIQCPILVCKGIITMNCNEQG